MQRLLLTLRYDGSRYHGWQVQKNGITVQETLQDAVERLTGIRSGLTGCQPYRCGGTCGDVLLRLRYRLPAARREDGEGAQCPSAPGYRRIRLPGGGGGFPSPVCRARKAVCLPDMERAGTESFLGGAGPSLPPAAGCGVFERTGGGLCGNA